MSFYNHLSWSFLSGENCPYICFLILETYNLSSLTLLYSFVYQIPFSSFPLLSMRCIDPSGCDMLMKPVSTQTYTAMCGHAID